MGYETFLQMDQYLDSPAGRKEVGKKTIEDPSGDLESEEEDSSDADEDEDLEIATGGRQGSKSSLSSAQMWCNAEGPDGMGCTATVALLKGGPKPEVFVANAGDSRCVLVRAGTAVPLSKDHKPTLRTERERIYRAGGFVNKEGRVDGNL